MTLSSHDPLSLDTNVLVHWIRQNETGINKIIEIKQRELSSTSYSRIM